MSKLIGRNDPCPCVSGKKYKKCCLNKIPSVQQEDFLLSQALCAGEIVIDNTSSNAESLADEIAIDTFLFCGDLPALIAHLRDVHERSFEQLKTGIDYIRSIEDDPANDPFVGWEKFY